MESLSLSSLLEKPENFNTLVVLLESDGVLLFDGTDLSELPHYFSCRLHKRLIHGCDWARITGKEYRFNHIWLSRSDDGTVYTREVSLRPFRGKRFAAHFGETGELERGTFQDGMLSRILDALGSSVLVVEAERQDAETPHRILFASDGFTRLHGYTSEEVVGHSPKILQGPESEAGALNEMKAAMGVWRPTTVELVNYHKNGRRVDCQVRIAPVADESGWYQYWVGFQEDAGEKRRIAEELQLTQFVLRSLGVGLWRLDQARDNLTWDEGMFKLYGIAPEDFNGSLDDWRCRLVEEDKKQANEILSQMSQNADSDFDTYFSILTPGGERKNIAARSKVVTSESDTNSIMYGINIDRTQAVVMREAIDRQRSVMERQDRYAAMGEMASGIGHEIRTPLQIALSYTEMLESNRDVPKKKLSAIKTALERIQSISDGLRNFGRSDAAALSEVFDFSELIQESISLIKPVYRAEEITIDYKGNHSTEFLVEGNRTRLQQVLMNLFSNARDAMSACEQKRIDVNLGNFGSEYVLVVSDSGPGIDPSIRHTLFEAQVTTKALGKGTGLGLHMVKTIIEEFGGTVEVSSECGQLQGATFVVTLPAAQSPVPMANPSEAISSL